MKENGKKNKGGGVWLKVVEKSSCEGMYRQERSGGINGGNIIG